MCSCPVSGGGVEVMVVAVGFFCQRAGGIAALPICVDGPVVVCPGSVLAAISRASEQQAGFVAVVRAIAASIACSYRVSTAWKAPPLLPAVAGQKDDKESDDQ